MGHMGTPVLPPVSQGQQQSPSENQICGGPGGCKTAMPARGWNMALWADSWRVLRASLSIQQDTDREGHTHILGQDCTKPPGALKARRYAEEGE